jgi:hypothetical protein
MKNWPNAALKRIKSVKENREEELFGGRFEGKGTPGVENRLMSVS